MNALHRLEVLLERLTPGYSLARLTLNGRDDEAIDILAETIQTMSGHAPPPDCATVRRWAASFDRYVARADGGIPPHLVAEAHHAAGAPLEHQPRASARVGLCAGSAVRDLEPRGRILPRGGRASVEAGDGHSADAAEVALRYDSAKR